MAVMEICDFNFVPNLWIFNAALCYYTITVDFFFPSFMLLVFLILIYIFMF